MIEKVPRFVVRIKETGQCLDQLPSAVDRRKAYVGPKERCELLAVKYFGEYWDEKTELVPVTKTEFLAFLGRQVTINRKRHLKRAAREPRHSRRKQRARNIERRPVGRPNTGQNFWWHNGKLAIRSKTPGQANLLARRIDRTIKKGTVRKTWIHAKPAEYLPEQNGVYVLNGEKWERYI